MAGDIGDGGSCSGRATGPTLLAPPKRAALRSKEAPVAPDSATARRKLLFARGLSADGLPLRRRTPLLAPSQPKTPFHAASYISAQACIATAPASPWAPAAGAARRGACKVQVGPRWACEYVASAALTTREANGGEWKNERNWYDYGLGAVETSWPLTAFLPSTSLRG